MSDFFSKACVLARSEPGLPVLAVSASKLPVPSTRARDMRKSAVALQALRVSRIINVCVEHPARPEHRQLYEHLGIAYHHIPIEDRDDAPVPEDFLPRLLDAYRQHDAATGIVLVHCVSGVNRSMMAAALLLWSTTPSPRDVWPAAGHSLIDWLDRAQREQRGGWGILTNVLFRQHVHTFCLL